ncbi:hypothetical protein Gohar_028390 [Gossypium harknessii]|uniref:RRM domain-containing protein n=1 Tax=Gossypium harknessii TaxID=34285 RepID=A0A7J9I786_9ROSI|nr:hypothetical protein [Gossypium harknessii]
MAFSSKLGSLLRLNGQIPATSMLSSIHSMSTSTKKLFIGGIDTLDSWLKIRCRYHLYCVFDLNLCFLGLSYGTDDQTLKEAFSGFGDVTEAKIIIDRDTGRSRGFGFVNFADDESASNALSAMDVSYANERPSGGPRAYGGNGGFRGGDSFGRDAGY